MATSNRDSQTSGRRRHRHQNVQPPDDLKPPAAGTQHSPSVLYIHPAKQGLEFKAEDQTFGRPYGLFPLGLPALINNLRQHGIEVQGVNHPLEKQLNQNFRLDNWLHARRGAKVILIDMHWYEHCYGAVETARFCKQVLPEAWTVLGGLSASGFAREILENFPVVDFIVRGDAESPLLNLVQLLLQSGPVPDPRALADIPNLSYRTPQAEAVLENPVAYTAATHDLDSLDFVNIDFLDHYRQYYVHEYVVTDLQKARAALETPAPYTGRWVCTARGCKFNCSYCGGGRSAHKRLAGRVGLVVRSPDKVVEDLVRLRQLGVMQASISWDLAELGQDYWQAVFDGMRREKLKIGLYNEFFQMPDLEFVKALAEVGDPEHSAVAITPLSGNERVRRLNGKHYSTEELFDLLEILSRYKMYLLIYFSLNLPGETRQVFAETVDLAKEIYDFYPKSYLKILNTVHTIDPLSPMNVNAGKFGLSSHMMTFMDYYAYCRDTGRQDPHARAGMRRGYEMAGRDTADMEAMVAAWDAARQGRESSWWPVPLGW